MAPNERPPMQGGFNPQADVLCNEGRQPTARRSSETTMTSDSQRRHTRIACQAPAVISSPTGVLSGVCENLSLGGAFVRCERTPPCDRVSVTFHLPSLGPIEVAGEVLRSGPGGCGIRFTHLASTALVSICTFVGAVG
jgi:hypothetical protein